jgi:hypothetical protein
MRNVHLEFQIIAHILFISKTAGIKEIIIEHLLCVRFQVLTAASMMFRVVF